MPHSIKRMQFQGLQIPSVIWKIIYRHLSQSYNRGSLANTQVEGLFVTRVLEERNFWSAAQYGHEAGDIWDFILKTSLPIFA